MTDPNNPDADLEFIELYATHNFIEIQIIEDLLGDHDITHMSRKIEASQFPISVGAHGEHRVSVPSEDVERARALIEQAIADEAIHADQGEFLLP